MILLSFVLLPFISFFSLVLVFVLIGFAYYTFFNAGKWQATPGKRAVGIYIVRSEDGNAIDINRSIKRYFLVVGVFAIVNLMGYFSETTIPDSAYSPEGKRFAEIYAQSSYSAADVEEMAGLVDAYKADITRYNQENADPFTMILGLINILAAVYALGLAITVATHPQKAGWHDRICNTRVIRGRPGAPNLLQPTA